MRLPRPPRAHVTTHETAANPEGSRTAFLFRVPHPSPSHPSRPERSQNRGSHSAITGHQRLLSAEQVQHHRGGGVHDGARQHGLGHFPRAAGGRPEDTKAAAVRRGDSRRHLEVQPHPSQQQHHPGDVHVIVEGGVQGALRARGQPLLHFANGGIADGRSSTRWTSSSAPTTWRGRETASARTATAALMESRRSSSNPT